MEIDNETLKNRDGDEDKHHKTLENRFLIEKNFLTLQISNVQNGVKMDIVNFLKIFLHCFYSNLLKGHCEK